MSKVLIVEDEGILVDAYSLKLEKAGFTVDSAINGKEALEKAKDFCPDIILLDYMMPVMDGPEFLQKYRSNKENCAYVIIMSNTSNKEYIKEAMDLGAEEFIDKTNISLQELVTKLERIK